MGFTVTTVDKWREVADFNEPVADYFDINGVLFSATKKGGAIYVHVACDKKNIMNLRASCALFIQLMFSMFDWCNMLIAAVDKKSVYNLCRKLGFIDCGKVKSANLMVIKRWAQ